MPIEELLTLQRQIYTGEIPEFSSLADAHLPDKQVFSRLQNLTAEETPSVGAPFVTAFAAFSLARLESCQCVIVSGAAGAVGNGQAVAESL